MSFLTVCPLLDFPFLTAFWRVYNRFTLSCCQARSGRAGKMQATNQADLVLLHRPTVKIANCKVILPSDITSFLLFSWHEIWLVSFLWNIYKINKIYKINALFCREDGRWNSQTSKQFFASVSSGLWCLCTSEPPTVKSNSIFNFLLKNHFDNDT
jgi:hypothetical protein